MKASDLIFKMVKYLSCLWSLTLGACIAGLPGFHTGFLAGGGRNTDSTCVGMHEMMFTRKHVCKL